MLDRARTEVGSDINAHRERIAELEAQLKEAHGKTERAMSMAQQAKSGFVYVISNKGSFGDNVVKIGMTRRLDSKKRVKELGSFHLRWILTR